MSNLIAGIQRFVGLWHWMLGLYCTGKAWR